MKKFTINGKNYNAKGFDFNLLCDMEDLGVSMDTMTSKPMSAVRAYFSMCADTTPDIAGKEMEAHMVSGGQLDEIMETMLEMMNESDFFRALSKDTETEDGKGESKKSKSN